MPGLTLQKSHLDWMLGNEVNVYLVSFVSDLGEQGFNSNEIGRRLEASIFFDAWSLTESGVVRFEKGNHLKDKGKVKFSRKETVIHYPSDNLKNVFEGVDSYYRKLKMFLKKRDLGRDSDVPRKPIILENFYARDLDASYFQIILNDCRFLSVWPEYWGELGSHCYIITTYSEKHVVDFFKLDGEINGVSA